MKFDWRRRSPARSWLLLRPGLGEGSWHWLLVANGEPLREGDGRPPADLGAQVALIVPGPLCSHFQVPAPPGLKRDEWPLLLEDRLLQSGDEVQCACLSRHPGRLQLVGVERQRLAQWLNTCASWGLEVGRCWAEFQLLPAPQAGHALHWQRDGELDLFKGRSEEGQEHWLAWPTALGSELPASWGQLRYERLDGRWPARLAVLEGLPGLFEVRRSRRRLSLPRNQMRLALTCLLLASLWGGLWLVQQWRQAQLYRAQVLAVTGEQATPRQAALALKRLQAVDLERQLHLRQLDGLQAQLQDWLRQRPDWRLLAVRFDGQRWHLRLNGEDASPPWQDMASAAGAQVEIQADGQPGQWQVTFDLGGAS
ncbi:type II secretion system protein GspL [Pseudomonas sp. X10]